MELIGNAIQRTFLIKYKDKEYCVNYLNADYPTPLLLNRNNWEVIDEDGEELQTYQIKSSNNKEKNKIEENIKTFNRIINLCVKKFNSYNPKL